MLQTKALYNLLRLNAADDQSVDAEPWALEDLRALSLDVLFARLEPYQLKLDRESFLPFGEQCETPEELAEILLYDGAPEEAHDPFYLLIFEVWRRLLPEKQSLSIFCDEIDHRIAIYDQGGNDELVQDALANLLEVLEENADAGAEPEEIFEAIADYCANDLETFLYDYISDLLDTGNSLYASELIEGFSPYVAEPFWFDFLRVRLVAFTDVGDANLAMQRLLENELDLSLLLEILPYTEGETFKIALKKIVSLNLGEEELAELLELLAECPDQIKGATPTTRQELEALVN